MGPDGGVAVRLGGVEVGPFHAGGVQAFQAAGHGENAVGPVGTHPHDLLGRHEHPAAAVGPKGVLHRAHHVGVGQKGLHLLPGQEEDVYLMFIHRLFLLGGGDAARGHYAFRYSPRMDRSSTSSRRFMMRSTSLSHCSAVKMVAVATRKFSIHSSRV